MFQLCLCPFGSAHELHWQTLSESCDPFILCLCYTPTTNAPWNRFIALSRCWDLSAGNLKWIYQVPILAAIVVRKGDLNQKSIKDWYSEYIVLNLDFGFFPCRWIFSCSLTSFVYWPLNCGKPTRANWTPDSSTGNPPRKIVDVFNLWTLSSHLFDKKHQWNKLFVLQEATQVHISPHAFVWSSLHGVHGSSLHWGHWAAVAGADALRDVLQLFPGQDTFIKTSTACNYML